VFVDVLSELETRHRAFLKASDERILFAEQRIYILARLAFVVMYGLNTGCWPRARDGPRRSMPVQGTMPRFEPAPATRLGAAKGGSGGPSHSRFGGCVRGLVVIA
jgi:hypothetical protein